MPLPKRSDIQPIEIQDGAGNQRTANVTAANELNTLTSAQPGVDIGDVTINNAAGASAVNVQDGGNSLTVDQTTHDNLNLNANLQIANIDVPGGAGAVTANVPRATLASDDPAVIALQAIDDWDETDRAKVNLIAGQVGIVGGTGVDAVNAPRVSLATNIPLPAGTNEIGSVGIKKYTAPTSGELAGSVSAVQMPSITCSMVNFKAVLSNAGNVYIGISGVTVVDGTTDTTTGFELGPGDETGFIPVDNLNRFYRISNNAGDDLTYLTY